MSAIFKELVAFFGGQIRTGAALGVSQGTVSGWVRGVHGCSAEVAILAEEKTAGIFKACQLRTSLTKASPTLNTNLRSISSADQSGNPSVQPSSNGGAP